MSFLCLLEFYFLPELSEQECSMLVDNNEDLPEACRRYESVKARLDARQSDPFVGMTPGGQRAVRNAQIQRRMSTRHGQGVQGKKTSWF